LESISIKLDLVHPFFARRSLCHALRKTWCDEIRKLTGLAAENC
jgi:hypothetical protein